jgi:hypothetical protein
MGETDNLQVIGHICDCDAKLVFGVAKKKTSILKNN